MVYGYLVLQTQGLEVPKEGFFGNLGGLWGDLPEKQRALPAVADDSVGAARGRQVIAASENASYLAGPAQVTLTAACQRFEITATTPGRPRSRKFVATVHDLGSSPARIGPFFLYLTQ
jgi:hypothetical protein